MPHFYFNVREGARFTEDEEGLELDSLDVAEHEAAIAAAEIGRDRLPSSDDRRVTIELLDADRQRLLTITVSMDIDRVAPEPKPRSAS